MPNQRRRRRISVEQRAAMVAGKRAKKLELEKKLDLEKLASALNANKVSAEPAFTQANSPSGYGVNRLPAPAAIPRRLIRTERKEFYADGSIEESVATFNPNSY